MTQKKSLWGKIKQGLGVGTVKVAFRNIPTALGSGDTIVSGTVVLSARSDQNVLGVSVMLKKDDQFKKPDGSYDTKSYELGSQKFEKPFTMKGGEEKEIPFSFAIQMPKSARAGGATVKAGSFSFTVSGASGGGPESSHLYLHASADVEGAALDPNTVKEIGLST